MFNFLSNTIIFDGFISSLSFFKSYISFKLNTPLHLEKKNDDKKNDEKKDIIHNRIIEKSKIYNLPIVERYVLYGFISIVQISLFKGLSFFMGDEIETNRTNSIYLNNFVDYSLSFIVSIPFFQNILFNEKSVYKFVNRRNLFFRYSFSRLILNYISQLNPKITGIKNYHTFILSRHIKLKLILDTFKTFIFIGLLHLLRDNQTTYYYYKAIKLSYFYNKGYLFNVINQDHAVHIINKIIKEKKWGEISNEENSNAFYCLIVENMSKNAKINTTLLHIISLFFSSLWSIFCLVNLLSLHTIAFGIYTTICIIGTIFEIFTIGFVKKVLLSGSFAFLLSYFYVNELLVTIIYFSIIYNKIPSYIINEMLFFLKNYKDIEKVIEFYNKKI